MKVAILIPARLESTRLSRKLLLKETGRYLIEHTYEAASNSRKAQQVIVATDSIEIFQAIESIGGQATMTSADHANGTDRIAEAAAEMDVDLVVNVQGDEPEIKGETIDKLIGLFDEKPTAKIATLATPIRNLDDYQNPSCVKVVLDNQQKALYFSRSPIPGMKKLPKNESPLEEWPESILQHIGIYAYRADCLQQICKLSPTPLEEIESLEQLRFLSHGYPIHVQIVEHCAHGIDTPEDYASFVNRHGKG